MDDEQTTPMPAEDGQTTTNESDQEQEHAQVQETTSTSTAGASDRPSPTADPRTTIAGRYAVDLQAPPESAGISVVYIGRDLRTREPVHVKTLRHEYRGDPDMRARFRREARLLQFLSHPHVIRALSFTEERGAPWLVLERVPGRTLRETMANSAPMTPEAVVPLLSGLAAALDHLHARGLVHLDVRPENIVVSPTGDVKLIDFGIAQTAGILQERVESSPEQIPYLAPEQISGSPVTVATDVYALGCVVYELLTGQPPFGAPSAPFDRNAALRARLEQPARTPTAVRGGGQLPSWIDDVVLGAIEREPRQRYSSAGSFAAVFHSGVEGDVDVETGRPRMPERAASRRQFPTNEPAIAVKGSRKLASRRGENTTGDPTATAVVDATFSPLLPEKPVAFRTSGGRISGLDVDTLVRRLWQAVMVAAALNVLLFAALMTRGGAPAIWPGAQEIGPGVSVSIAGSGLVARAEPTMDSAIVADLPDGGQVRISGDAVQGDGGRWWPVEIPTDSGVVNGFVPENWVQQP